jgi:AraC family transcriptional regulator of adaptative response / DNA-3-methyladenine glycosylase II
VQRSENGQTAGQGRATPQVVKLDADTCYRALCARDRRFDGLLYVGVTTTGVYCRPICPARTAGRTRCQFFARAAEAERAGFRACFRCRPELAPGLAPVDSVPRLVRAATEQIEAGFLNQRSVEDLATELGVTARHLRRALEAELGVTPVELAQTRRLALAKQLLHDTKLPLAQVAFASGFASVRRFNAAFQRRFGRAPSALRKHRSTSASDFIALRLDYRPPLDWEALLAFLAGRAIPGVERVSGGEYARSVSLGGLEGWLAVTADPAQPSLRARVSVSLAPVLMEVAARLRALFDLDAQPSAVAAHLQREALLAPLLRRRPGLRVPGAFDGFEMAVRAVLGQQISVRAATTLCGRLVAGFGRPVELGVGGLERIFPGAERLATASIEQVRALGVTAMRARTLLGLAVAVAEGRLELSGRADPELAIARLCELPGIGPWTAHYLAMRALRWPNAFPAADLVLCKALGVSSARRAEARAASWQPWRAYAVMHLWQASSDNAATSARS